MSGVFIVGAGMTPLGKHVDKSVKALAAQAVDAALADAAVPLAVVEEAACVVTILEREG